MKSYWIIIIFSLIKFSLIAQTYQFLNSEGSEISSEKFIDYKNYRAEYIPVKKESGWGVLNIQDGLAVECKYDDIKPGKITPDIFMVKKGENWGIVDASGAILLPIEYEAVKYFDDEIAIVSIDFYWVMINYKGEKLIDGSYDGFSHNDAKEPIWFVKNNRYELFSRTGKKLSNRSFQYMTEFGRLRMVTDGWHKTGVIDTKTGQIVVPLKYDKVTVLNDKLVEVAKSKVKYDGYGPQPRATDFIYGVYSVPLRKEIVPSTFNNISVNEKYIQATMTGYTTRSSYYNYQGKVLNPDQLPEVSGIEQFGFREIVPFSKSSFAVLNQKNDRGVVTYKNGVLKWVASPRGYFKEIKNIQVGETLFPYVLFIGYNYTEVYDVNGKMMLRTKYSNLDKIKSTPSVVSYKNYDPKSGKTIYLDFTKEGSIQERSNMQGDRLAATFQSADGKYGLKKADGTIILPANKKSIETKKINERNIFIVTNGG
jgi:hypothetical protein